MRGKKGGSLWMSFVGGVDEKEESWICVDVIYMCSA